MPTKEQLLFLLWQARSWFSFHPKIEGGVQVEAAPQDVQEWMKTVDRETAPTPLDPPSEV